MWAVIWHDLHTDADVFVFDTKDEAQQAAVEMLIDYLESYWNWSDRVNYAHLLASLPWDVAYQLDWYRDKYLDGDLENLYFTVTEVSTWAQP